MCESFDKYINWSACIIPTYRGLSDTDCQLLQKSSEYFEAEIALTEQYIFELRMIFLLDKNMFLIDLVALMRQKIVHFHHRDVKGLVAGINARFILRQFFVLRPSFHSIVSKIFTYLGGIDTRLLSCVTSTVVCNIFIICLCFFNRPITVDTEPKVLIIFICS